MSCVCIITPVVVANWPLITSAFVSATTTLGYQVAREEVARQRRSQKADAVHKVDLEIPRSEVVTSGLERDQKIRVVRDGVSVVFAKDARGKATLCVTGERHTDEELRAMGEEISRKLVQSYVYEKLKSEMAARDFTLVEEEVNEDESIRLKVRHWDH